MHCVLTAGGTGFNFRNKEEDILLSRVSKPDVEPAQVRDQWTVGETSSGGKAARAGS
jgi:hypothetical protein